jgi:hypothetical protein
MRDIANNPTTLFVPVTSQDLHFQPQMSWSFLCSVSSVMKVKINIFAESVIGQAVILVIMYVETFKTDGIYFYL